MWAWDTRSSPNNLFKLSMTDGNLMLVRQTDGVVMWSSNTKGSGCMKAVMQGDGNFVVALDNGIPRWTSGTRMPDSFLKVQDDGNLVVYGAYWHAKANGGLKEMATNLRASVVDIAASEKAEAVPQGVVIGGPAKA